MSVQIRHLYDGETPTLLGEFAGFDLQPAWCWVAEDDQREVIGVLMGGRLHGMFVLLRLAIAENAPKATALALLRYGFKQARLRGLKGCITLLEPGRPTEYKLGKLLQRMGANFFPLQHPTLLVGCSIESRFIH